MLEVVRASAGSGKTHFLTKEYLLMALSNPDSFKNILAVTFTNKAADEMKERIVSELSELNLGDSSAYWHDVKKTFPQLSNTEIKQKAKVILTQILHNYSDFAVSTIDSFIQRLIKSFSYEIGINKAFGLQLDVDDVLKELSESLFEQSRNNIQLHKWMRDFASFKIADGKSWNFDAQIQELAYELFKENFDSNKNNPLEIENYHEIIKKLKQQKRKYEKQVKTIAQQAKDVFDENKNIKITAKLKTIKAYLTQKILVFSSYEKVIPVKTVQAAIDDESGWYNKTAKVNEKQEALHMRNLLFPLLNSFLDLLYSDEYIQYMSARLILNNFYSYVLILEIEKLLPQYRQNNNALLISDTNKLLHELVANNDAPFIYEKIGTRFKHLLIDEFQDTSSYQWENFVPLIENSLSEGHKNLIVGDVKQSIYRWRNGDWKILQQGVKERFQSMVKENTLQYNWRSKKNIVDFNNTIFKLLANEMQNLVNKQIAQLANEEDKNRINDLGFNTIIEDAYKDVVQKLPRKGTRKGGRVQLEFYSGKSSEYVSNRLPELIEKLILHDEYKPEDIAILVRSNAQGNDIAQNLYQYMNEEERLKYDIISPESLTISNSSAVNFVMSALKYIYKPDDDIHKSNLLINYNHFNKNKYTINEILENRDSLFSLDLPKEFNTYVSEASHYPIYENAQFIIKIFDVKNSDNKAFIDTFLEAVYEFSNKGNTSIQRFFEWWDDKGSTLSVQVPENIKALQIMTVHKSKGLAFNVVILPYTDDPLKGKASILWCENSWEDFSELHKPAITYSENMLKSYYSKDYLEELIYNNMDALNLLYVAFTRPKNELIAFAPKINEKNPKISYTGHLLYSIINTPKINHTDQEETLDIPSYWKDGKFILDTGFEPLERDHKGQENFFEFIQKESLLNWRENLNIRSKIDDFLIESIRARHDKVAYGTFMHKILSRINYYDEIDDVLDDLFYQNILSKEQKEEFLPLITQFVNFEGAKNWFSREWQVLNEQGIINNEGELRIPDRMISNGKEMIVIDYKFAIPLEEHKTQVLEYIKLIQNLQNLPVKGYLYYPLEEKIIEIKE